MGWLIFFGLIVLVAWLEVRSEHKKGASVAKTAAMGVGGYMVGKTIAKGITGEKRTNDEIAADYKKWEDERKRNR